MKKLKYLSLLLAFMLLTTGCVKFNANMNIKKDKSMDFSIIYALNTSYFSNKESISSKDRKELKKEGFKVEKYSKDNMEGFKLTKNVKNIDKVSSTKDTKYSLSGVVENKNNSDKVFKVKKGLFKNHYIAKFDFNMGDSSLSNDKSNITSYLSNMDLSYNVTLPYKAIKNNATSTNKDKTKLTWDLTKHDKETIEFEFELYNKTNIIVFIFVVVILIGVGTFFIVKSVIGSKKDKKEEKK